MQKAFLLIVMLAGWATAAAAQVEPQATDTTGSEVTENGSEAIVRILVTVALTRDVGTRPNCDQMVELGLRNGLVGELRTDDILLLGFVRETRTSDGESCEFVDFQAAGVTSAGDVQFFVTGFGETGEARIELKSQTVLEDVGTAIDSRFRAIPIPVGRLLTYEDASGDVRRIQHGQTIRVAVRRRAQPEENAVAGLEEGHEFRTRFDFRVSRPTMWSGFSFPTIFGFTFGRGEEDNTWRALPVTLATGVRFGLGGDFAPYMDVLIYAAPAFRLGGSGEGEATPEDPESGASAEPTTAALGVLFDFGGKLGIGVGADVDFNGPARLMLSLSVLSDLLPRFAG